jgi:hypothetical protein
MPTRIFTYQDVGFPAEVDLNPGGEGQSPFAVVRYLDAHGLAPSYMTVTTAAEARQRAQEWITAAGLLERGNLNGPEAGTP